MYSLIGLDRIIEVIKERNLDSQDKDFYDFGVGSGAGTAQILEAFKLSGVTFNKCWGFDSWKGLPEETPGLYVPDVWHKGAFNYAKDAGVTSDQMMPRVMDYLKKYNNNVELISGFFKDSLNNDLVRLEAFKSAFLVSIDVDLHLSCYQALDFMAENNLLVKGTVIRYDDWGDFTHPLWKGVKEYEIGESRAHKEICEKYNLIFENVFLESGVKIVILVSLKIP